MWRKKNDREVMKTTREYNISDYDSNAVHKNTTSPKGWMYSKHISGIIMQTFDSKKKKSVINMVH